MDAKEAITVQAVVKAPVEKVWKLWTGPEHITKWNHATDDWHAPRASNDLRKGGRFSCRMEAKDGSAGFDFTGVYDDVREYELISYTMEDGRKVRVVFKKLGGNGTGVVESFDPEGANPAEMQRSGWQAILDSFKRYVESS